MFDSLARMPTERGVRSVVDELNGRIRELNRIPPMEGPPSNLMPLDMDYVLGRWAEERERQ